MYFADAMFDFSKNEFPLRDRWFLDKFMHQSLKAPMIGIGMVSAAALIADRVNRGMLLEYRMRYALVVVAASTALLPISACRFTVVRGVLRATAATPPISSCSIAYLQISRLDIAFPPGILPVRYRYRRLLRFGSQNTPQRHTP